MNQAVKKLTNRISRNFIKQVKKHPVIYGGALLILIFYYFSLPKQLFNDPISTVVTDANKDLLGAKIADDGQWRFPANDSVPVKFKKAIICFEDKHFYKHPGFNPVSILRALYLNIKHQTVKSGGSTISMQVIRMARKNRKRSFFEKILEIILSTRLEIQYSKDEILALYSSHAPFGGNVVGLDAASWRYFQRSAQDLSWAEAATLAILPNAPALIHPGKNRNALLSKRNRLLKALYHEGIIDSLTMDFALLERIPDKPYPLPQDAYHLMMELYQGEGNSKITQTSIDGRLQKEINKVVQFHAKNLKANEIYNIAALVAEVKTGKVLAYVGNVDYTEKNKRGNKVNVVTAPRSSGSILKPLLYAAMLNEGQILPGTLIPDIPTNMTGFNPQNFNLKFDGAVPASQALSRSLNIPAVRMLKKYSLSKFHFLVQKLGLKTIDKAPLHYGLSLILGGAEVSLWDICGAYASLSRTLVHHTEGTGYYNPNNIRPLNINPNYIEPHLEEEKEKGLINAASIWLTYKALLEVNRPAEEMGWKYFAGSKKIAWKTGTSYGFRDAWSIGTTPEYVVGVWVGNASGEGRPGCIGVSAAGPVMFDIFKKLPATTWFQQPEDEMVQTVVCNKSGHRIGENCEHGDTIWIAREGLDTDVCPYHTIVHLDENEQYRVKSSCYPINKMVHKPWFVLPPVQEYYYKSRKPSYQPLPHFKPGCSENNIKNMDIIYPSQGMKLYVPVELSGEMGQIVIEAVHKNPKAELFWHLNDSYIGTTTDIHQIGISPKSGKYTLTVIDNNGHEITRQFEVISKK